MGFVIAFVVVVVVYPQISMALGNQPFAKIVFGLEVDRDLFLVIEPISMVLVIGIGLSSLDLFFSVRKQKSPLNHEPKNTHDK